MRAERPAGSSGDGVGGRAGVEFSACLGSALRGGGVSRAPRSRSVPRLDAGSGAQAAGATVGSPRASFRERCWIGSRPERWFPAHSFTPVSTNSRPRIGVCLKRVARRRGTRACAPSAAAIPRRAARLRRRIDPGRGLGSTEARSASRSAHRHRRAGAGRTVGGRRAHLRRYLPSADLDFARAGSAAAFHISAGAPSSDVPLIAEALAQPGNQIRTADRRSGDAVAIAVPAHRQSARLPALRRAPPPGHRRDFLRSRSRAPGVSGHGEGGG